MGNSPRSHALPFLSFRLPTFSVGIGTGRQSVLKTDRSVRPVAERLVRRPAATAQRNPVPHFISKSVLATERNAAPNPERTAAALLRILDQAERRLEMRFVRLLSAGPRRQPAGRAVVGFANRQVAGLLPFHADQIPHLSFRIAKPGEGAIRAIVRQGDFRPFVPLGSVEQRFFGSRQRRIPVGSHVRAVAIRLVAGMAATTQRRRLGLGGILFSGLKLPNLTVPVRKHELLPQRRMSEHEVRPAGRNRHMKALGSRFAPGLDHQIFHILPV